MEKLPPKARKKKPKRRGRPHRSEGGVKARGRLLDAAEQLFAERGFYGVTTRQVASMADADDALIYYHFKNKWGLFNAVFERRARVLITARHDSLHAYVSTGGLKLTAHGAIAAFINPMIELSQNGDRGWKSYFALVAQIDNSPWGGEIIHRFFDSNVHELIEILRIPQPKSGDDQKRHRDAPHEGPSRPVVADTTDSGKTTLIGSLTHLSTIQLSVGTSS